MSKKTTEVAVVEKFKAAPTEQVVESVIDELEAFLVEGGKKYREINLQIFWETGRMLRDAEKTHKVNITALVERVVADARIKERQMGARNTWFALKMYDYSGGVFEKLFKTEYGDNITVSKFKKLLTTPKPTVEKTTQELAIAIVAKLGTEKALELADQIWKECKAQQKRERDERGA